MLRRIRFVSSASRKSLLRDRSVKSDARSNCPPPLHPRGAGSVSLSQDERDDVRNVAIGFGDRNAAWRKSRYVGMCRLVLGRAPQWTVADSGIRVGPASVARRHGPGHATTCTGAAEFLSSACKFVDRNDYSSGQRNSTCCAANTRSEGRLTMGSLVDILTD